MDYTFATEQIEGKLDGLGFSYNLSTELNQWRNSTICREADKMLTASQSRKPDSVVEIFASERGSTGKCSAMTQKHTKRIRSHKA